MNLGVGLALVALTVAGAGGETDRDTTLQRSDLDITVEGDVLRVNHAQFTQADIHARNGVIHVLDAVMVP